MQDHGRPTPIDLTTESCCLLCLSFPISRMGTINPMAGGWKGDFYLTAAASAWSRVCVGGQWVTHPASIRCLLTATLMSCCYCQLRGHSVLCILATHTPAYLDLGLLDPIPRFPPPSFIHTHPPPICHPSAQTITQQTPGLIAFHL